MAPHIFISHTSKDDGFVSALRAQLAAHKLMVWDDARRLRGGAKLLPEISEAIATARHFIVVFSQHTIDSDWVFDEIAQALQVEKQRADYRVIPLLLSDFKPAMLKRLKVFPDERLGIAIANTPNGLADAMPQILAALGEREPAEATPATEAEAQPLAELILELRDARIETNEGIKATATLIYAPADKSPRTVSQRYFFTAPLGPIEAPYWLEDLRWYLEEYYRWPAGLFQERAARIEAQLPQWGAALYQAALDHGAAQEPLLAWRQVAELHERRFSVLVESDLPAGASHEDQAAANEAAAALLTLPWELLRDQFGWLFQGKHAVRVRRTLPNRRAAREAKARLPIRILLVSPRPEDEQAGYIDHRISALPLVEALNELGGLAELTLLEPPTFPALQAALRRADEAQQPFDVIHFDGHGVYHREQGLGKLCFEKPEDSHLLNGRGTQLIDADKLAAPLRDHRIPLVFLEACQSAQADADPTASVAARLLTEGVTSVVAMSHSVLVETARRFVTAFYRELAAGARVGKAMLAGQQALHADDFRLRIAGAGELRLQDWFVPVLYQEEHDLQLITKLPRRDVIEVEAAARKYRLGEVPEPPPHTFIGRSRELLTLERMLSQASAPPYAVIRGRGGEGKTTLAAELARWLVLTQRYAQAAFVSLEQYSDARGLLDALGRQLLPSYSVAEHADLKTALQPVAQALRDRRTVIVLDNVESVLPEIAATGDTGITGKTVMAASQSSVLPEIAATGNTGITGKTVMAANPFDEPNDANTQESPRDPRVPRGSSKPEAIEKELAATNHSGESDASNTQENPRDPRVPRGSSHEILELCHELLAVTAQTRLLFTSREWLPAPFDHPQSRVTLGALSQSDAVALVSHVLRSAGLDLKHDATGTTPQEITDLVTTAGGHARALTLLARGLASQGARATADELRALMARLDREHPGDRENSLYASVELSLRRLPSELREQAKVLAVFHGGAHLSVIAMMLEADDATAQQLAAGLVEVGLAIEMNYGYLRLDPALPGLLLAQTEAETLRALTARWAEVMRVLTGFLYQQQSQDTQLAAQLTLLELPNLQALLAWAAEALPPESVVDLASRFETLIELLGRPQALAQVVSVRTAAAKRLSAWSGARFTNASSNIDRMLDQGDLQSACAAAAQLLERCLNAGVAAYPGADYDIAMAHFSLGLVLQIGGAAEQALTPLREARQRLQALANAGSTSAGQMASATITESATCLLDLGRYDEAVAAYEETIWRAEELGDLRSAAVGKFQLGTVRLEQERYAEALERYAEALKTFDALGEPGSVANAWHQIGIVHEQAGQFAQAEQASRQSLAMRVQHKLRAGEADSLLQLGNLYGAMVRLEEAAAFYRQAAEIHVQLQDLRSEGVTRSNLADTLIKLERYDEARRELLRAIECGKQFGHTAQRWKTWDILHDLEQATGNAQAAAEARGQAVAAYLAYRRAGGESQANAAPLYALVAEAIRQGTTDEAAIQLRDYVEQDDPAWLTALLDKLHAILDGTRAQSLAADPTLDYDDAVELTLLLESLAS